MAMMPHEVKDRQKKALYAELERKYKQDAQAVADTEAASRAETQPAHSLYGAQQPVSSPEDDQRVREIIQQAQKVPFQVGTQPQPPGIMSRVGSYLKEKLQPQPQGPPAPPPITPENDPNRLMPKVADAAVLPTKTPDVSMGDISLQPTQPEDPTKGQVQTPEELSSMNAAVERARDPKGALADAFNQAGVNPEQNTPDPAQSPKQADQPIAADPRAGTPTTPAEQPNTPPPTPAQEPPTAPEDRTPFYAALKGVENAGFMIAGQKAPEGGFYDAMIADEQGKQKRFETQQDYNRKLQDTRVTEALKQKFEAGQNDKNRALTEEQRKETGRSNLAKEKENALKEQELSGYRKTQDENRDIISAETERHDRAMEKNAAQRINVNIGGADSRLDKRFAKEAKLPNPGEIIALNDVLATLDEGTAPGTGFANNSPGWANFMKSPEGNRFQVALLALTNPELHHFGGSQLTDQEKQQVLSKLGLSDFNDPQTLNEAMHRLELEKVADQDQILAQVGPGAAKLLRDQGAIRPIGAKYGHSTNKPLSNVTIKGTEAGAQGAETDPLQGAAMNAAKQMGPELYDVGKKFLLNRAFGAGMRGPPAPPSNPGALDQGPGSYNKTQLMRRPEPRTSLESYLKEKHGGQVPQDYGDPQRKAVYAAIAMQDPEFRKKIREQEGIS